MTDSRIELRRNGVMHIFFFKSFITYILSIKYMSKAIPFFSKIKVPLLFTQACHWNIFTVILLEAAPIPLPPLIRTPQVSIMPCQTKLTAVYDHVLKSVFTSLDLFGLPQSQQSLPLFPRKSTNDFAIANERGVRSLPKAGKRFTSAQTLSELLDT